MRAAAIDRFGGPEVLLLQALPVPVLDATEVLITLDTAGVGVGTPTCGPGGHRRARHFPLVLGTDGAGIVAAVGSRVRRFRVGDQVYSYSFAKSEGRLLRRVRRGGRGKGRPRPRRAGSASRRCDPDDRAYRASRSGRCAALRKGEAVIIHGASGGVGTLAVQFAKLRGAQVLATASGKDGVALTLRLGADAAVDGKHEDIAAEVRRFAPGGIDAVLALAGGTALERCLSTVRRGGRVAYPNGVEPEPRPREGLKIISYDAVPGVREFERLGRAVEAAELEVPIASCYPLAEAAAAHERLAKGHVLGKIVLRVREEA